MSRSERPYSVGSEKEVKLNPPKSPEKESEDIVNELKVKKIFSIKVIIFKFNNLNDLFETNQFQIQTELAIKNSRITHSTPSEQHSELLHFIARKERKVLELREELKRHEEELRLLKKQWKTNITKKINEESNIN